jgi:hypothetical protein
MIIGEGRVEGETKKKIGRLRMQNHCWSIQKKKIWISK